jgi:iron complex outermembrane receptor protein
MKRALLRGSSAVTLIVVSGFWASQALAQAAPAAAAPAAADQANSGQVIVTAQRRNQAIEHVPVAVSAFTSKQRQVLGIATTQQLSDFTPGLSYFASNDRAYIRGIGRNTVNLATESGVATYYNGIYYGANASIAEQHDTLFVDQIEVDRGPQNTLHGSNADGGTINYISQRPTHSYYAEGRVGFQNYGEYYGEAVVSGPITDWLRFRVGGNYSKQDGGFFNNLVGAKEGGVLAQGNNGNQSYFEAQLDANFGPHLDGWAMFSAGNYDTSFHTASAVGLLGNYEFPNGNLSPSGFYGLCALPGQSLTTGCGGGQQAIVPGSVTTTAVNASQFPGNNPSNANIRDFIQQYHDSNRQTRDIAFATRWTYHFADADLQYLGGYQQFYYDLGVSGNGYDAGVNSYQLAGPPGLGNLTIYPGGEHTRFIENEQYFSHELSLASTTPGPVQWIGGLYWYHEHYDQPVDLGCYPFQTQLTTPLSLLGTPAALNPHSCEVNLDTNLTYDSYAGYGQVTWQITPEWKLEGGARYTDDHKSGLEQFRLIGFDAIGLGLPFAGAFTPAIDITPLATSPINPATGKPYPGTGVGFYNPVTGMEQRTLDASWNAVTGEATLTWQPDSTTLAYAKYSRGYKTGGFNGGQVAAFPETAPEYVDAIEGGVKKTWGSVFQINAAAFYYNYQNDQQPLTIQNSTGTLFADIFNIPTVHTYGVELEANWHPFQPVVFTADYTYLNATIASMDGKCVEDTVDPLAILPGSKTAGCPAPSGGVQLVNLVGSTLPESPRNKITLNATYTLNFEPGNLIISASYIWKDATYGSVFNIPQAQAPAYSQANLRVEWDDAKNRYNVSAFVNNIGDETGYDIVTPARISPAGSPYDLISARSLTFPLTFGGEIQYRFR